MALRVSDEALEKTTKCSWNYCCLEDETSPKCPAHTSMCKVETALDKLLFVYWNHEDCSYKLAFGDGFMCTCAVRFEIYKRYHM